MDIHALSCSSGAGMTVYLIEHIDGDGIATWGNDSADNHRYATGRTKPNYPMPAIIYPSCIDYIIEGAQQIFVAQWEAEINLSQHKPN